MPRTKKDPIAPQIRKELLKTSNRLTLKQIAEKYGTTYDYVSNVRRRLAEKQPIPKAHRAPVPDHGNDSTPTNQPTTGEGATYTGPAPGGKDGQKPLGGLELVHVQLTAQPETRGRTPPASRAGPEAVPAFRCGACSAEWTGPSAHCPGCGVKLA